MSSQDGTPNGPRRSEPQQQSAPAEDDAATNEKSDVGEPPTDETLEISSAELQPPTTLIEHKQEETRGMIAGGLVALLFVVVIFAFLALCGCEKADYDRIKGVLELIFAPLVALVGSATGFYFGGRGK